MILKHFPGGFSLTLLRCDPETFCKSFSLVAENARISGYTHPESFSKRFQPRHGFSSTLLKCDPETSSKTFQPRRGFSPTPCLGVILKPVPRGLSLTLVGCDPETFS